MTDERAKRARARILRYMGEEDRVPDGADIEHCEFYQIIKEECPDQTEEVERLLEIVARLKGAVRTGMAQFAHIRDNAKDGSIAMTASTGHDLLAGELHGDAEEAKAAQVVAGD